MICRAARDGSLLIGREAQRKIRNYPNHDVDTALRLISGCCLPELEPEDQARLKEWPNHHMYAFRVDWNGAPLYIKLVIDTKNLGAVELTSYKDADSPV